MKINNFIISYYRRGVREEFDWIGKYLPNISFKFECNVEKGVKNLQIIENKPSIIHFLNHFIVLAPTYVALWEIFISKAMHVLKICAHNILWCE